MADSGSQGSYRLGGIEVKDRLEVLRAKKGIRIQAAPGKQDVGGADGGCIKESHALVIIIIPLQIRPVNSAEDVLLAS